MNLRYQTKINGASVNLRSLMAADTPSLERMGQSEMASYAVVETALARMHGADPEVQRGAFRGRIKHFQRLGLPTGERPGKGKRIDYTPSQILQLALAIELAQCGIDPTIIVGLIAGNWSKILNAPLRKAALSTGPESDRYLVIDVGFMSASWGTWKKGLEGIYAIRWIDAPDVAKLIEQSEQRRMIAINASYMLRRLDYELLAASSHEGDTNGYGTQTSST